MTPRARIHRRQRTSSTATRAVRVAGGVTLLVALLGTGACGGDAAEGSASTATNGGETAEIDPCSLLTGAEVAKVLGTPVDGAPDERITTTTNCVWSPDGPEGRNLTISLVGLGGSGHGWKPADFHGGMKGLGEPVGGIGDAAYGKAEVEDRTFGPYAQIDVLHHGDRWFQLVYQPADDEQGLTEAAMSAVALDTARPVVDRH